MTPPVNTPRAHPAVRQVLDSASKAFVTVAVMLSILLIVKSPVGPDPAKPLTALLLAIGTIGLVALNFGGRNRSRR